MGINTFDNYEITYSGGEIRHGGVAIGSRGPVTRGNAICEPHLNLYA